MNFFRIDQFEIVNGLAPDQLQRQQRRHHHRRNHRICSEKKINRVLSNCCYFARAGMLLFGGEMLFGDEPLWLSWSLEVIKLLMNLLLSMKQC